MAGEKGGKAKKKWSKARTKEKLNSILVERTGQPLDVIVRDTDRDNYMTAEEAKSYGLIDQVIAGH